MHQAESDKPVFVILGATESVGSELARRITMSGDRVVLAGRDRESLQALGEELDCPIHDVEANDPDSITRCLHSSAESCGRIDGIVNCIGSVLLKAAHATSDEEWNETIAVNLTSAFTVVRAAGTLMRRSGGSVVLMSSAAAQIDLPITRRSRLRKRASLV